MRISLHFSLSPSTKHPNMNPFTLAGLFNTLGRVVSGWLSDRPWADCILIHNLALIVAGISTCAVPFISQYYVIAAYCAVFGSCIGECDVIVSMTNVTSRNYVFVFFCSCVHCSAFDRSRRTSRSSKTFQLFRNSSSFPRNSFHYWFAVVW